MKRRSLPAIHALSTAVSDAILAVTSIGAALLLVRARRAAIRLGGACLLFLGMSAAVGAARFAGADLAPIHGAMAWTGRMLVLPLFAAAFVLTAFRVRAGRIIWYAVAAVLAVLSFVIPHSLRSLPGAIGMIAVVVAGARALPRDMAAGLLAIGGAAIYMIAGLAVGTDGTIGAVQRVDIFHYSLAAANPMLAAGLVRMERET